jgi:hypothetical protein
MGGEVNRQRRAAKKRLGPDQHWQRQSVDVLVEDVHTNTLGCRYGTCTARAVRWYLRTDLADRRLVIYPTCLLHLEQAEAASCDEPGCLAPDEDHYVPTHDDLVPQLAIALDARFGIGFPMRGNWDRLDVIRPVA